MFICFNDKPLDVLRISISILTDVKDTKFILLTSKELIYPCTHVEGMQEAWSHTCSNSFWNSFNRRLGGPTACLFFL